MQHTYAVCVRWTGNTGLGTAAYDAYSRDLDIVTDGKPVIHGSADPAFRGDTTRHNPEDLFLSAISACHMLWYLHLCAEANVVVSEYEDHAFGTMVVPMSGGGRFEEVVLRPAVTIEPSSDREAATRLHEPAHARCFIANSVDFPIRCEPTIRLAETEN